MNSERNHHTTETVGEHTINRANHSGESVTLKLYDLDASGVTFDLDGAAYRLECYEDGTFVARDGEGIEVVEGDFDADCGVAYAYDFQRGIARHNSSEEHGEPMLAAVFSAAQVLCNT